MIIYLVEISNNQQNQLKLLYFMSIGFAITSQVTRTAGIILPFYQDRLNY